MLLLRRTEKRKNIKHPLKLFRVYLSSLLTKGSNNLKFIYYEKLIYSTYMQTVINGCSN